MTKIKILLLQAQRVGQPLRLRLDNPLGELRQALLGAAGNRGKIEQQLRRAFPGKLLQ